MKTISGLRPVRAGRILFDGKDISSVPAHDRGAAGPHQAPRARVFPGMTVWRTSRCAYTPPFPPCLLPITPPLFHNFLTFCILCSPLPSILFTHIYYLLLSLQLPYSFPSPPHHIFLPLSFNTLPLIHSSSSTSHHLSPPFLTPPPFHPHHPSPSSLPSFSSFFLPL
jgi:hypothetical protein